MNSPENKKAVTRKLLWEIVQRYANAKVGIADMKETKYLTPELMARTEEACDVLMQEVISRLPIPSGDTNLE